MTNKRILIIGSSGGIGKAFIDFYKQQDINNKIIGLSRSGEKYQESLHAHYFIDLEMSNQLKMLQTKRRCMDLIK